VSKRFTLCALPLLLAACDGAPLSPDLDPQLHASQATTIANSQGLFRLDGSQVPYYTRTEPPADAGGFAYHTDEWAAIVFYRDPACVPADFNLFAFFDIPGAFFCSPTIKGHALHTEPLGMTPPLMANLQGNAVPIWFVPWSGPFQQAVEAGMLTMSHLSAMPGLLKGVAIHYHEMLTTIESHPTPMINVTARGEILPESGGGSFRYNVNYPGLTVEGVKNVKIVIH
jgi:hypothetical protein